jgi:hypothetical protein
MSATFPGVSAKTTWSAAIIGQGMDFACSCAGRPTDRLGELLCIIEAGVLRLPLNWLPSNKSIRVETKRAPDQP